jgi:hypothetical protein
MSNVIKHNILPISVSTMIFLGDLKSPERRFSSDQKEIFIHTNIDKDYLLQQRRCNGCLKHLR